MMPVANAPGSIYKVGDVVMTDQVTGRMEKGIVLHVGPADHGCGILVRFYNEIWCGHDGNGTYNFPRGVVSNAWWTFSDSLLLCEESKVDKILNKYSNV